tara:strand:- start:7402 stop:7638 length:237 start_codon:yes stop_codon:yes gene_type:complete
MPYFKVFCHERLINMFVEPTINQSHINTKRLKNHFIGYFTDVTYKELELYVEDEEYEIKDTTILDSNKTYIMEFDDDE